MDWQKFAVLFQWVNFRFLMQGFALTIEMSLWTIAASFVIGIVLGTMRYSGHGLIGRLAGLYIEIVRNLPALFFIVLARVKIHLSPVTGVIIGMVIFNCAIMGEIVRGGLVSVERGQWEAARSQGFNVLQIFWYIVLPQALRRMIPPIVSQFITIVKDTSFTQLVGIEELTGRGAIIFGKYANAMQTFFVIACIYFIVNYLLSILSRRLERRLAAHSY